MVRIDFEPPTPRDPFYRCPARDVSLVWRVDLVRLRRETRHTRSPPPLASRLRGGLQRDGSARVAAARSQARPRCVRALSREHQPAAPRLQGARNVGSDASEGIRAAPLALGTRPPGSADRRWDSRTFEPADALRPVSSRQERARAQRARGANPRASAWRAGSLARDSFGFARGVDGSQVELSVDRWRAPVKTARDRPRESK